MFHLVISLCAFFSSCFGRMLNISGSSQSETQTCGNDICFFGCLIPGIHKLYWIKKNFDLNAHSSHAVALGDLSVLPNPTPRIIQWNITQ